MVDENVAVEIWKKTVDVQQHFNDLELRIRNFALVVTGAFLAFGGSATKDAGHLTLFGVHISVAAFIVYAAILPLMAFYFMDKYWYHRLLDGAVRAGIEAEETLKNLGYSIELGLLISEASPIGNWVYGKKQPNTGVLLFPYRKMHSRHKMDVFYCLLLASLLVIGTAIALGVPEPAHADQVQTTPTHCTLTASTACT